METATAQGRPLRTTVIEPATGWKLPSLKKDLWDQRDLIYFLARRDIAVRYRQSLLGIFWTVFQAVLIAAVFTVFLGNYANIPSAPGVEYSLFAITGMLLWIFFTTALVASSNSTVTSATVIQKVYFPRMAIPVAALFPATVDFIAGFGVIIILTLAYGIVPGPQIVLFPFLMLLVMASALGIGLWFSALNVKYRDIYVLLPFLTLVGLFVSPILYPFELIEQQAPAVVQPLYALNPMVGILEAYRWMLLDTPFPGWDLILIPIVGSILLLISGGLYFKRAEPSFADVI